MNSTRSIILADGTVLEDSECGYAERTLWCMLKGMTFAEVFAVFSDTAKTSRIEYILLNKKYTFIGFTELTLIQQSEFTVDVRLTGESTEIIEENI